MNLTEKILSVHCGRTNVTPGEILTVRVDLVYSMDPAALLAFRDFKKLGVASVFDPGKVIVFPQVLGPAKGVLLAGGLKSLRETCRNLGVAYVEEGRGGLAEQVIPEMGLIGPGDIVIGADSHTCTFGALGAFATGMGSTDIAVAMVTGETWLKVPESMKLVYHGRLRPWVGAKDMILYTIGDIGVEGANYKAIEFSGEAARALSMDGRFTMANMAMEAGAKTGLFEADEKTIAFLKDKRPGPIQPLRADPDAAYETVIEYDVSNLEPQVAFPSLPSNAKPISQAGQVEIDMVKIGMCTNGNISDLRLAARILEGKKIHPRVRCMVVPPSQTIYLQALREGLLEIFVRAGATVESPSCAPCLGTLGTLAEGERCVSTSNRNFVGRQGHARSEIYLAGPAVAAASAIAGRLIGPEEVMP